MVRRLVTVGLAVNAAAANHYVEPTAHSLHMHVHVQQQQQNVSCVGGGSLASCNATLPACCNVGSYEPQLTCFDPRQSHCCHYGGGPAGPPSGSLCERTSVANKCCVQMCYNSGVSQCCQDQYGEGHTCKVEETCQINGCGPAPPDSGSWCYQHNSTVGTTASASLAVTIDSEASTLTLTTAAASCVDLSYTYDASGEFPGQGEILLHSSAGTCLPDRMGPQWVDTLLVWSGQGRPIIILNKQAPTLPPLLPLAPGATCPVKGPTM